MIALMFAHIETIAYASPANNFQSQFALFTCVDTRTLAFCTHVFVYVVAKHVFQWRNAHTFYGASARLSGPVRCNLSRHLHEETDYKMNKKAP